MILKAIKFGVTEEHIAKTLNVNVSKIQQNTNLLNGICPEAVELLKVKHITANALRILSKMKPLRQVEVAELLIAANNFTFPYMKALFAATSQDQLCEREKSKKIDEFSVEDMALMEKEMKSLELDFKYYEESYGTNNLKIIQARGYISKLLKNGSIVQYLLKNYSEILSEFQKIIEVSSLED